MSQIILASASKSRRDLLTGAGLEIDVIVSHVDEEILKARGFSVVDTALELAKEKASVVSRDHPDAFVIGADQMMECEGHRFDKPTSLENATEQLRTLRGKTHHLISAVSIVKNGECLWSHSETASLEMRSFSDEFLTDYLEKIGNDVFSTVGGYRLESIGVQLFNRIEGDYFTILGLPLLAVLDFLRMQDIIDK